MQTQRMIPRPRNLMTFAILFLAIIGLAGQTTHAGISVSVSGPGAFIADTILCGQPVTFNIRLQNDCGSNIGIFNHGFRLYSPDGAVWNSLIYDSTGGLGDYMEIVEMGEYSNDGVDADTVYIAGISYTDDLPTWYDEIVFTITTQVDNSQDGLTLCLDSCWYPPNGDWLWLVNSAPFYPSWDGPHCFHLLQPTPPEIVAISPAQNELNVQASTNITVTFNTDIDEATVNGSTFVVNARSAGPIQGSITYDGPSMTATFNPSNDFKPGEIVTVTLTDGIESNVGVPLDDSYVWSFTILAGSGPAIFAEDSAYTVDGATRGLYCADFNGDGYIDFAASNADGDNITVRLNDGTGVFGSPANYSVNDDPQSVFAADLDGDDDIDIITANRNANNISVLMNEGSGTFSAYVTYAVGLAPFYVYAADLDGDGDNDLAVANNDSHNVSILINNGSGTFASGGTCATPQYPNSVHAADLDGDGDLDLVTANYYSTVSVLLNNGNATFAASIEYAVTTWPFYAFPADLDDDGDLDLAIANYGSHTVTTLLNNGSGVFGSLASYSVGVYPRSIAVCDYDGDGNLDLAVSNTQSDDVSVLMNNGNGTFATHVTYPVGDSPGWLFGADFDDDGDIDLAVTNFIDSTVSILMNAMSPQISYTSPTQNELNVSASTNIMVTFDIEMDETTINNSTFVVNARSTGLIQGTITYDSPSQTVTFNPYDDFEVGDIVTVVLTTGIESSAGASIDNSYSWSFTVMVNNGYGIFVKWASYLMSDKPHTIYGGDFNGDGIIDLATANYLNDRISIFLNNGTGTFAISANYDVGSEPVNVCAADLDGDDDLDLVSFNHAGSVSVLMNNGNGTFSASVDYPVVGYLGYGQIADLDGDGDLDLAAPDVYAGVTIFLNDGNGIFPSTTNHPIPAQNPGAVCTADLDGDGDIDLATVNGSTDIVSILFNNGNGTFAPNVNYGVGSMPWHIQSADLNGDGAMDLAVVNAISNNVTILMNDGSGLFLPGTSYGVGSVPMSIVASDVDGDGDIDLTTTNMDSDNISVLLNYGNGVFATHLTYDANLQPASIYSADIDDDGDMDMAIANRNVNNITILMNHQVGVIETNPADSLTCVELDSTIYVGFSTDIDPLTIDNTTFLVNGSISGNIAGGIGYSIPFRYAVFDPIGSFIPEEIITVTLTTGIQSVSGVPMENDYTFSFSTLHSKLISYKPDTNGYWFPNEEAYVWPSGKKFPNWKVWVKAFGKSACYWVYNKYCKIPNYWMKLRCGVVKKPWQGSCFGFSISSFLFYNNFLNLSGVFGVPNVINIPWTKDSRYFINKYQVHTFGWRHIANNLLLRQISSPKKTLADCKDMFTDLLADDRVLSMFKDFAKLKGHAVNPYKCGPDAYDADLYHIYVYDSNNPFSDTIRVTIDTTNNTWSFNGFDPNWNGVRNIWLVEPTSEYDRRPLKLDMGSPGGKWDKDSSEFEDHRKLFFTEVDSAYLESPEGYVGYSTDSLFGTDTNAAPIIIPGGSGDNPPYGYFLPRDNWNGWFHNIADTMFQYAMFLDSTAMYYSRESADSTQQEHLDYREYDSSLMIHNPGAGSRLYNFEAVSMAADSQFVMAISDINISPGESIRYSFTDEPVLQLDNYGGATTYGLRLEIYNAEDYALFSCSEVPLGGNTSHRINPDWRPFDDAARIMIDEGMTGVYTDSFFCVNEGVDICIPGEVNNDKAINILDITYLISYLYGSPQGDPPVPYGVCSGDTNCDCAINILDITSLIDVIYYENSDLCSSEDWIFDCDGPLGK